MPKPKGKKGRQIVLESGGLLCFLVVHCRSLTHSLVWIVHVTAGKGGKNRRRGKGDGEESKRELEFKEDGEWQLLSLVWREFDVVTLVGGERREGGMVHGRKRKDCRGGDYPLCSRIDVRTKNCFTIYLDEFLDLLNG